MLELLKIIAIGGTIIPLFAIYMNHRSKGVGIFFGGGGRSVGANSTRCSAI